MTEPVNYHEKVLMLIALINLIGIILSAVIRDMSMFFPFVVNFLLIIVWFLFHSWFERVAARRAADTVRPVDVEVSTA
jgi:hypothetical protein